MTKTVNNTISDFFFSIGKSFTGSGDFREILYNILESLSENFSVERSMIHIYSKESDMMHVDVFYGYKESEVEKGVYRSGEGVVGRVHESGVAELIEEISTNPDFLNKTGARSESTENVAFICIPIKLDEKVIGTLSADIDKAAVSISLAKIFETLNILSVMIANLLGNRIGFLEKEKQLIEENRKLRIKLKNSKALDKMVGESGLMKELNENILMVAPTNSTVLITGESGTGKELIADAIEANSKRQGNPYIKVNIAALSESLIESELFGYEKGAFTGASASKAGRFEAADGGTIFLDEIGDLSYNLQVKLLRVIQEKTVERVGGNKTIPVDVRIIAATHQNLEKKIEEGVFRADLYYRLNVFPVHAPSLRDRKSDILLLADYFIEKYSAEIEKPIVRISSEAIDMLTAYHWPGNVRELENCIHRAIIVAKDSVLRSYDFPPTLQMISDSDAPKRRRNFEDLIEGYEKELIIDHLKMTRGNITRAAQILGTTKRILTYKVKKLSIDYRKYR